MVKISGRTELSFLNSFIDSYLTSHMKRFKVSYISWDVRMTHWLTGMELSKGVPSSTGAVYVHFEFMSLRKEWIHLTLAMSKKKIKK